SCYVEITAPGGAPSIKEFGSVELTADGKIVARSGSTPFGQGHHTTWAMIVADRLGVDMADITVITGDTDAVPSSNTTGGSRSVQIAGSAMADASQKLIDAAKPLAADLLEAAVDDITLDPETGHFHVVGTPARAIAWAQVAEAAPQPLVLENDFAQTAPTFPFGTHICVAEVDTETGAVRIERFVGVDDAGTLINPLLAAGQVHGGIAAGIAQALLEDGTFDADGNLISSNFADYAIISAAELPMFERHVSVTPTPLNPLGAKGIGESGSIGATPAVQNAVIDAVAHLGVTHIDMPLTPQRIWSALQSSGTVRGPD
ncbi:MAG: xanthine dehydrogenase family protein molybdopterin-binding subunit, partial [Acidimicrobiales bacterium]|nr:xanthine dehydrogenase family protein molybdopterin-binding subunit [Acidimicrobiales bacterium]